MQMEMIKRTKMQSESSENRIMKSTKRDNFFLELTSIDEFANNAIPLGLGILLRAS